MSEFSLPDLIFYLTAAIVVGCGCYAAMARNIVRAVFSLLGLFFGVAVLYALLAADLVAVIQLMVYVGGILVLMLFAVMLTSNIEAINVSNRSQGLILGLSAGAILLIMLLPLALSAPWMQTNPGEYAPTTAAIGEILLGPALLPFEIVSILLLAVVIGAVVVARKKQGVKQ